MFLLYWLVKIFAGIAVLAGVAIVFLMTISKYADKPFSLRPMMIYASLLMFTGVFFYFTKYYDATPTEMPSQDNLTQIISQDFNRIG